MKGYQLFLKENEAKFAAMAVLALLEEMEEANKDITMPWNPETRKDLKDIVAAGRSLATKMKKLGFNMEDLPPYKEGDIQDFITKES